MTIQEPKIIMNDDMQTNDEKTGDAPPPRQPYEKPAVIYAGIISTRAGSGGTGSVPNGVDPADIFGQ